MPYGETTSILPSVSAPLSANGTCVDFSFIQRRICLQICPADASFTKNLTSDSILLYMCKINSTQNVFTP